MTRQDHEVVHVLVEEREELVGNVENDFIQDEHLLPIGWIVVFWVLRQYCVLKTPHKQFEALPGEIGEVLSHDSGLLQ